MNLSPMLLGSLLGIALWAAIGSQARADAVTEANEKAAAIASAHAPTPIAVRTMAIVQVAVHDALSAISGRYPAIVSRLERAPGASAEAAVAAATMAVLAKLVPDEEAAIEADYAAALAAIPDGDAKAAGIAVGDRAAAAVLAARADDGADLPERYVPRTTAGVYVPTTRPLLPQWGGRRPWVMTRSGAFRPGPPPALSSATWARDFNEIKSIGALKSTVRSPEQTAMAKFWEVTSPTVYWPVARSVALGPGRDLAENARLLATAGMAMDDALIAVFDAKYAYGFWRPITAIRNADLDENDATAPDSGWTPFIETPLHPEYPCAHCIVSASLGAVIEAEAAGGSTAVLTTSSPTAGGASRSWATARDFEREVAEARIYDGVHYRNSTEVGTEMGRKIGTLAARRMPRAARAGAGKESRRGR